MPADVLAPWATAAHELPPMPELDLIIRPDAPAARTLPANIEAEAAFLGAVLIDNRVTEDLPVQLAPVHFFEAVHGRIFERIQQLLDRNAVVTPVTLRPYFEADVCLRSTPCLSAPRHPIHQKNQWYRSYSFLDMYLKQKTTGNGILRFGRK